MTRLAIFRRFFGFFHFQTFFPFVSDSHLSRAEGRVETKVAYAFFIFCFFLKVKIFEIFPFLRLSDFPRVGRVLVIHSNCFGCASGHARREPRRLGSPISSLFLLFGQRWTFSKIFFFHDFVDFPRIGRLLSIESN